MTYGKIASKDGPAKRHDKGMKDTRDIIIPPKELTLVKRYKVSKRSGIQPDGGVWVTADNIPVIAFEAKKQGMRGNAQERLFKNYHHLQCINPTVKYIVLMMGEGVLVDGPLYNTAHDTLDLEGNIINIINDTGASFFLNENGFTEEEIMEIMKKGLEACV